MAKVKTLTRNKLKDPKVLVLLIFLLGFGAFGVWKLAFSSAATPPPPLHVVVSDAANASAISPKLNVIQDVVPFINGGAQVVQLSGDQSASFSPQRGADDPGYKLKRTCALVRPVDTDVLVEVVSGNHVQSVTVPASQNYYSRVCTGYNKPTKRLPGFNYDVRNVQGGLLNVYQVIYEYSPITTTTTAEQ